MLILKQAMTVFGKEICTDWDQEWDFPFTPLGTDPVLTCEGRELIFNVLLSARSTEQLNRELQALSVLEKSEELLHFGNQNHSIAIKTCSSNADGTHTPPGTVARRRGEHNGVQLPGLLSPPSPPPEHKHSPLCGRWELLGLVISQCLAVWQFQDGRTSIPRTPEPAWRSYDQEGHRNCCKYVPGWSCDCRDAATVISVRTCRQSLFSVLL